MSLKESRAELGTLLAADLGRNWSVFPDGRDPGDVTKPTLLLSRSKVQPLPSAPRSGARLSTFELALIAPQHASDDALEGWLEDLLDALDRLTDIIWTEAERGVWPASNPTNPAYTIPFTRTTTKEV